MPLTKRSVGAATVLLTLAVCVPLGAVAAPVEAAGPAVSVTNATHTPTTPVAGEPFEVTATVRNHAGAGGSFTVNEVAVEVPGTGPRGYSVADDLGTLTPGGEITVTLPAVADDPGWKQLTVHVYGQTLSGRALHIQHPVTVKIVDEQRPQLDVSFTDGVVGAESTVNVTVANGQTESVRNLRLELAGDGVSVERPTRVGSVLAAESETDYRFEVTPTRPGEHTLRARLTYTDTVGTTRTVTEQFRYGVDPLDRRVTLDVATVRGERTAVDVTVVNLGNAPLEEVAVTGESGDASISTGLLESVPASASRTVRLNVTDPAGTDTSLSVTADYEVAGERHETTREVAAAFAPGRIDLTGVATDASNEGTVRITGTASNVGTSRVQAVTVRVLSTDTVTPANPGKEYFVGTVDASDFASFTVTARVDGENETTIPMRVTYLVDGEERSRTVEATYDPPEPTERRDGGGLALVAVGAGLVALVAGVVVWRRRRAA